MRIHLTAAAATAGGLFFFLSSSSDAFSNPSMLLFKLSPHSQSQSQSQTRTPLLLPRLSLYRGDSVWNDNTNNDESSTSSTLTASTLVAEPTTVPVKDTKEQFHRSLLAARLEYERRDARKNDASIPNDDNMNVEQMMMTTSTTVPAATEEPGIVNDDSPLPSSSSSLSSSSSSSQYTFQRALLKARLEMESKMKQQDEVSSKIVIDDSSLPLSLSSSSSPSDNKKKHYNFQRALLKARLEMESSLSTTKKSTKNNNAVVVLNHNDNHVEPEVELSPISDDDDNNNYNFQRALLKARLDMESAVRLRTSGLINDNDNDNVILKPIVASEKADDSVLAELASDDDDGSVQSEAKDNYNFQRALLKARLDMESAVRMTTSGLINDNDNDNVILKPTVASEKEDDIVLAELASDDGDDDDDSVQLETKEEEEEVEVSSALSTVDVLDIEEESLPEFLVEPIEDTPAITPSSEVQEEEAKVETSAPAAVEVPVSSSIVDGTAAMEEITIAARDTTPTLTVPSKNNNDDGSNPQSLPPKLQQIPEIVSKLTPNILESLKPEFGALELQKDTINFVDDVDLVGYMASHMTQGIALGAKAVFLAVKASSNQETKNKIADDDDNDDQKAAMTAAGRSVKEFSSALSAFAALSLRLGERTKEYVVETNEKRRVEMEQQRLERLEAERIAKEARIEAERIAEQERIQNEQQRKLKEAQLQLERQVEERRLQLEKQALEDIRRRREEMIRRIDVMTAAAEKQAADEVKEQSQRDKIRLLAQLEKERNGVGQEDTTTTTTTTTICPSEQSNKSAVPFFAQKA